VSGCGRGCQGSEVGFLIAQRSFHSGECDDGFFEWRFGSGRCGCVDRGVARAFSSRRGLHDRITVRAFDRFVCYGIVNDDSAVDGRIELRPFTLLSRGVIVRVQLLIRSS